jgi:hypothetical protein
VIKSAASILAEIGDTKPVKRRRRITDRAPKPQPVAKPKSRFEPRPVTIPRDDDYFDNARAYRLAAIEYGVHPLMPRNLYRRTS